MSKVSGDSLERGEAVRQTDRQTDRGLVLNWSGAAEYTYEE